MRKSKIAKFSKRQIPKLKRKLWSLLSKYIRVRDKGICFTCERRAEGSGYHAGHCIPKSICGKVLEFNYKNLAGQCYHCNINCGGNGAIFAAKLQEKFGRDIISLLNETRLERK